LKGSCDCREGRKENKALWFCFLLLSLEEATLFLD
jgi:hypothetical protein